CRGAFAKRLFTNFSAWHKHRYADCSFFEHTRLKRINNLLANQPEITQNELMMKPYSLLVAMMITAITCVSLFAEDKTILGVLQGNTGKTVELRMQCGEKIGGKVEQVNDNVVLLSHLTGADYFDGVVNLKDISAVITRSAGK